MQQRSAIRRLLAPNNLDASAIKGTGVGGRSTVKTCGKHLRRSRRKEIFVSSSEKFRLAVTYEKRADDLPGVSVRVERLKQFCSSLLLTRSTKST